MQKRGKRARIGKKSFSGVITAVLLILIAIITVAIVYVVVTKVLSSSKQKAEEQVTCLTSIDLDILDSCYGADYIQFTLKNNNAFDYETDFFVLKVVRQGETLNLVPTVRPNSINGLEQRVFTADILDADKIEKLVFIPKIKEQAGYCYGQAIEFIPERQC